MTTLKSNNDLAIPQGSLILITGATGYIGSNVVQEALDAGFRVRGTVRSQDKADQSKAIHKDHPNYETALVPDMQADGAFDAAVRDVHAIIHLASITTFSPDPAEVVGPTIQAAVGIMRSALACPSVRRFVYCSSSVAAAFPRPNTEYHLDADTWNDAAERYADLPPPYTSDQGFPVYCASKVKAERAVWAFVREHRPRFAVNAVLPNCNLGRIVFTPGVTGDIVPQLWRGQVPFLPPQYMIDVVDDARIHLAAAVDGSLVDRRIFAFDAPFNYTDIVAVLKELRPEHNGFPDLPVDEGRDISTVDNALGAELLRKWFGQDGYKGLRASVEENLDERYL